MPAQRNDESARGSARSLAQWLRSWNDSDLAALVSARPDLAVPTPSDTSVLALRAGERTHVSRALEPLDRYTLAVVDAILLLPAPVRLDDVSALVGADVAPVIQVLTERALVWGADELIPVSGLAPSIERPAGLGRPLATLLRRTDRGLVAAMMAANNLPLTADIDEAVARLVRVLGPAVADLDTAQRAVLAEVDRGGAVGSVANAYAPIDAADPSPVRRLLARGLLVPLDDQSVELPREVGLALRGAAWFPAVPRQAPPLVSAGPRRADADAAGAQVAVELVRLVGLLLEDWAARPPVELKSGGLGQRDLRASARALGLDEPTCALLIEVARTAGLIGRTSSLDTRFAPTAWYDTWRRQSAPQRWSNLAAAWVDMPLDAAQVGGRDGRDKVAAALTTGAFRPQVRVLRRAVLEASAAASPTETPSVQSLLARISWLAPRRFQHTQTTAVEDVLREATAIGIVAAGGLTSYARGLLIGPQAKAPGTAAETGSTVAAALAAAMPTPIDHVLLQADLTAVAPGLLLPELADQLAQLADVESPGSATVYRFSAASLRRALDLGWDASAITDFLTHVGKPAVPQALSYLIEDTARRHGQLRIGSAGSYVRCDDEALLAEAVADRRCADLGLRRLAATVMVSSLAAGPLLDGLRAAGYAPVAEHTDGSVKLTRADGARAARGIPFPRSEHVFGPADAARVIASVRAGDRAITVPNAAVSSVATTLDLLDQAVREGRPVVLGYINAQGQDSRRIVEPERVAGGLLTAYDHRTQERRSFALHRITDLALADGGGA